jgi:hypothetical protein
MTDYKVIAADSSLVLSTGVKKLMAEGWEPQGGLAVVWMVGGARFYQAMVRNANDV